MLGNSPESFQGVYYYQALLPQDNRPSEGHRDCVAVPDQHLPELQPPEVNTFDNQKAKRLVGEDKSNSSTDSHSSLVGIGQCQRVPDELRSTVAQAEEALLRRSVGQLQVDTLVIDPV